MGGSELAPQRMWLVVALLGLWLAKRTLVEDHRSALSFVELQIVELGLSFRRICFKVLLCVLDLLPGIDITSKPFPLGDEKHQPQKAVTNRCRFFSLLAIALPRPLRHRLIAYHKLACSRLQVDCLYAAATPSKTQPNLRANTTFYSHRFPSPPDHQTRPRCCSEGGAKGFLSILLFTTLCVRLLVIEQQIICFAFSTSCLSRSP